MKPIGNKKLTDLCDRLMGDDHLITAERKALLEALAEAIIGHVRAAGRCDVVAICTHNSRRSQLVELWLALAARHFGVSQLYTWSGGTEATSFNYRAVYALQYRGFEFFKSKGGTNPHYQTHDLPQHVFFSKKYDDPFNPDRNFLAVTVCDHADKNCPVVHGASRRLFIPYVDPKVADDTDKEVGTYADKVDEIGREMLYCIGFLKDMTDRINH